MDEYEKLFRRMQMRGEIGNVAEAGGSTALSITVWLVCFVIKAAIYFYIGRAIIGWLGI